MRILPQIVFCVFVTDFFCGGLCGATDDSITSLIFGDIINLLRAQLLFLETDSLFSWNGQFRKKSSLCGTKSSFVLFCLFASRNMIWMLSGKIDYGACIYVYACMYIQVCLSSCVCWCIYFLPNDMLSPVSSLTVITVLSCHAATANNLQNSQRLTHTRSNMHAFVHTQVHRAGSRCFSVRHTHTHQIETAQTCSWLWIWTVFSWKKKWNLMLSNIAFGLKHNANLQI